MNTTHLREIAAFLNRMADKADEMDKPVLDEPQTCPTPSA
jgi:hypothetical protein